MSRPLRPGGGYEVHVLGDREEPEVIRSFGSDGMKALVFYTREVVVARRRGLLLIGDTLPGIEPEVIDSFTPSETNMPLRGGMSWRLGAPEPAFREPMSQREKLEREESDHPDRGDVVAYAKGFIDALGDLSPFDRQCDPYEFASWFGRSEYLNVSQGWKVWSEQRREETGK